MKVWTASMSAALRPQIPMVPAHLELPNAVPSRVLASSSYAHASSSSAKSAHDQKVDHKGAANSSSAPAAAAAPTDALRYTVNEPTVIVKDEHAETSSATETANGNSAPAPAAVQPVNGEAKAQTSASEATDASEAVKVKVEGDSDSDSSDVSDEEELDTSTWTNSLMSLYEEPVRTRCRLHVYFGLWREKGDLFSSLCSPALPPNPIVVSFPTKVGLMRISIHFLSNGPVQYLSNAKNCDFLFASPFACFNHFQTAYIG